jgi:hypothetical protein
MGAVLVAMAWLASATVPLWQLALGPVFLGVPHLVADVRYLVVRPGLARRTGWLVAMGVPLIAATWTGSAALGLMSPLAAALFSRASSVRRLGVAAVCLALAAVALRFPGAARLAVLHLHNVVAVGLWWLWRPRTLRASVVPVAIVAGVAALLCGLGDPLLRATGGWTSAGTGLGFDGLMAELAPFGVSFFAFRCVLVFAFLQAVHYVLWLRLIPEDDRPRAAPRTFRASAQALRAELGPVWLGACALASLGVLLWAAVNLPAARVGYLRLSGAHAYLELAVAALWVCEGRPARSSRSVAVAPDEPAHSAVLSWSDGSPSSTPRVPAAVPLEASCKRG